MKWHQTGQVSAQGRVCFRPPRGSGAHWGSFARLCFGRGAGAGVLSLPAQVSPWRATVTSAPPSHLGGARCISKSVYCSPWSYRRQALLRNFCREVTRASELAPGCVGSRVMNCGCHGRAQRLGQNWRSLTWHCLTPRPFTRECPLPVPCALMLASWWHRRALVSICPTQPGHLWGAHWAPGGRCCQCRRIRAKSLLSWGAPLDEGEGHTVKEINCKTTGPRCSLEIYFILFFYTHLRKVEGQAHHDTWGQRGCELRLGAGRPLCLG